MILSITGTPGTGKTIVAKILKKGIKNSKLIQIKSLLKKNRITCGYDKKRKSWIIDIRKLQKAITNMTPYPNLAYIIDGHLAHFVKSDYIFILRCSPKILEKRLKRKGWSKSKIRENVEAEMVDVINYEALKAKKSKKIFEIDTTRKTPEAIAKTILRNIQKR